MRIMRITKAPFESKYKARITQLCLVFPLKDGEDKDWRRVLFDDGKEEDVEYIHLSPYKRWLNQAGGDVRGVMDKEMEGYMFRINWLGSQILKKERSAEYKMLIKLYGEDDSEGLLEAAHNDIRIMDKEVESLWKSYHWCKFHCQDLDSEEKLIKAEEVYKRKLKRDFWDSDFKPLPTGEVQTLF